MTVIRVESLTKTYWVRKGGFILQRKLQKFIALNQVSFKVKRGELVGLLGPNGAGKTTLLKCLTGLLYPDKGKIRVLGFNPWQKKPEFLKLISFVMGQKTQLWWELPPWETFLLNKEIYQIKDKEFQNILNELTELLEVKEIIHIPTRKLSLGQRMKCELIAALLHQPQILFLDEPTLGLDVVMQKKLRDFIKKYNQEKKATIVLTSHYMQDVQELCKRVIIIDKGTLVFDGQLAEIVDKHIDHKLIRILLKSKVERYKLEKLAQVKIYQFPQVVLCVSKRDVSFVTQQLLKNYPVVDLSIEELPIEDIIRHLFIQKNY
jgi:ABC-2 type transport system ATP-binding protein